MRELDATGQYGYGSGPDVVTQLELEESDRGHDGKAATPRVEGKKNVVIDAVRALAQRAAGLLPHRLHGGRQERPGDQAAIRRPTSTCSTGT